jgi:hypothetical protein
VPSAGTHAQCVEEVQASLPCGSAKKVSASYSRCVSQMKSTSCAVLFPNGQLDLPADCNMVILTARTGGAEEMTPVNSTTADSLLFSEALD